MAYAQPNPKKQAWLDTQRKRREDEERAYAIHKTPQQIAADAARQRERRAA